MVSIEGDNRIAAESMFAEILAEPVNQRRSNREAKERRERRTAFLTKADELLSQYPDPESEENEKLTLPVDFSVGVHAVRLQVKKYIHPFGDNPDHAREDISTSLQGRLLETDQVYNLFEIQQETSRYGTTRGLVYSRKTLIYDHEKKATDASYLRALQTINFIAEELPKQHPQTQNPRVQ